MILAPYCNCRHPGDLKYGDLHGTGIDMHGWQVMCAKCGTSGPVCEAQDEEGEPKEKEEKAKMKAVRKWNKMSQNCGQV